MQIWSGFRWLPKFTDHFISKNTSIVKKYEDPISLQRSPAGLRGGHTSNIKLKEKRGDGREGKRRGEDGRAKRGEVDCPLTQIPVFAAGNGDSVSNNKQKIYT